MAAGWPELVECPRLLYVCPHTAIYVSPYYYKSVPILLCPQTSCCSCCRGVAAVAEVLQLLQRCCISPYDCVHRLLLI